MGVKEEVEVLKKVPFFAKIDPAKLKLLAFTSERVSFKPDQFLCKQGDIGDAAFIILEGRADVLLDTDDGPLTVASFGTNDIVGEIAILIDVPRTASVKATENVTTLKITKDLFFQMVSDFPDIAIEVMRVLAQRLERTNAQLREARGH
jgi:CRP-like cAMP-binding protein